MTLTLDDIKQAADQYFGKLSAFANNYKLDIPAPVTIGWKVEDINEFGDALADFFKNDLVQQCHVGFVDKRYIASIVFKQPIFKTAQILKLMQRRPHSTDPTGLDHMDFVVDNLQAFEVTLKECKVPKWSHESNEVHGWISMWFDNTEAKFNDHIVLDAGVKELQDTIRTLGFEPKQVD